MEMKDVARALGVELGEVFGVTSPFFKYKLEKDGLKFWSEDSQEWIDSNLIEDLFAGKAKIIKLPIQILTDSEKRYLSNVIEPFRDRVMYIIKGGPSTSEYKYILIYLKHYNGRRSDLSDLVKLPSFEKETMYKGMKPGKKYILEELNL